jgi:hypothetical protein
MHQILCQTFTLFGFGSGKQMQVTPEEKPLLSSSSFLNLA